MPHTHPLRTFALAAGFAVGGLAAGCQRQDSPQPAAPAVAAPVNPTPAVAAAGGTTRPATGPTTRPAFAVAGDEAHLPNAHVVTAKIISGGQPEGDDAFKMLRDMGVKTIISVDGTKPDVEAARKYGLRYVHLPIGYDGVSPDQGKAIAKAIDELPGPIYLHCHHGKHRSAAAVAVACVYNGMIPPDEAEDVLKTFGTGENYKGLWKAAREARPVDPGELKRLDVPFVEITKIPPLADTMVGVDDRWDHLKLVQKAGWKAPKDHPDLDPPHEALQLEELFREAQRLDSTHAKSEDFKQQMIAAGEGTKALREVLAAKPIDPAAAEAAFKRVASSCAACHKAHRD